MAGLYKSGSRPGTIVAVRGVGGEDAPRQGVVQVEGQNGRLTETQDIIIVTATLQQQVAYKTAPTIGGPEYLFVFGDRLSPMSVSCILFQDDLCSGDGEESNTNQTNGVISVFKFYAENRLTPGDAPLLTIAYNGATIQGFLVGVKFESQNNRGRQVHSAVLQIIGWVDHESVGSANTQASASLGGPQPAAAGDGFSGSLSQQTVVGSVSDAAGASAIASAASFAAVEAGGAA